MLARLIIDWSAPPLPKSKVMEGWKNIPIKECNEGLVPLGMFSEYPSIITNSVYYGQTDWSPYRRGQLEGALLTVFVRYGVAERLAKAAAMLAQYRIVIVAVDGYRPLEVQQALYQWYVDKLVKQGMSSKQAAIDAQQYVSLPSTDLTRPAPHNTGGAVDLIFVRLPKSSWKRYCELLSNTQLPQVAPSHAAWLERDRVVRTEGVLVDVGTAFDEASEAAETNFFERPLWKLSWRELCIRQNRRLIQYVMRSVGFVGYRHEHWHFDHGDQFAAQQIGGAAKYGVIRLSPTNERHEQMMRQFDDGLNQIQQLTRAEFDRLVSGCRDRQYTTLAYFVWRPEVERVPITATNYKPKACVL